MADASHQRRVEESCAECGVAVTAEIWDVADLAARPELAAGLRDGSHWRRSAPMATPIGSTRRW